MIRSVFGARGQLPRRVGRVVISRSFGSSLVRRNYDSTLKTLEIGSHTRVIFQGFTGKQATANAKESIEWGTNIVGGIRPGFEGEHLGLPVLPTVRKAMEVLRPDVTGIYVAAHQATAAIEEAIEAEVPLIVAVAEHIPLHDMIRIHAMLKMQSKSRLVGANSPGIISAVGKCRIGFQPLPCFEPGRVGIVARSGTLSYESQTMCIGVGGDILPGTTLKDGLQVLTQDPNTEAIALVGEIGGEAEIEAADWIKEYRARTAKPKPIAAIIGGIKAAPGRIMGHAGAFALPGEPSTQDKIEALQAAGCAIVNHPARFGPVLKSMLDGSTPSGYGVGTPSTGAGFQRRGIHTFMRRPTSSAVKTRTQQARSIYLSQATSFDLLRQRGLPVVDSASKPNEGHLLAVTLNRSTSSPCVIASASAHGGTKKLRKFDYDYGVGAESLDIGAIASQLGLDASNDDAISSLRTIITGLITLFAEKEAYLLETRLVASKSASPELAIDVRALRRVVFVAGGVGVNPLVSMLGSLAAASTTPTTPGFEVHFLYSLKDPGTGKRRARDMLFVERIARLFREGKLKGGRFQVFLTGGVQGAEHEEDEEDKVITCDGDGDGDGKGDNTIPFLPRRCNVDDDIAEVVGTPAERRFAVVYVCGVPAMTDEFVARLTDREHGLGMDPYRVLCEKWWLLALRKTDVRCKLQSVNGTMYWYDDYGVLVYNDVGIYDYYNVTPLLIM
ncbi:hypothetical protein CHU98_g11962 [Xylaria longipes]|nr:hypothetical protein CHU98_g11962 [Xylaria longipes]